MKKFGALALTLLIVMTMFAGCTGDNGADKGQEVFKVGYINSADTDIFDKKKKDVFSEVVGGDATVDVSFADANMDMQKQLDAIDNFIAQKMDLLVVVPVDKEGIIPGIEKANDAGIPVICLGIAAGGGDFIFIGSNNYDAGKMQGEYAVENLPENAKVLYLSGTPGYQHSVDRRQGFLDAIAARDDIEVLSEQTAMYERARGMRIAEDWIQTFPKFEGLIAANDQMALGALEALKGANRLEGVLVSGVDGTQDACIAIKNGEMAQSIFQSAPGLAKAAYETIQKFQNGEDVESEIMVPFESITIDNVDDYLE